MAFFKNKIWKNFVFNKIKNFLKVKYISTFLALTYL